MLTHCQQTERLLQMMSMNLRNPLTIPLLLLFTLLNYLMNYPNGIQLQLPQPFILYHVFFKQSHHIIQYYVRNQLFDSSLDSLLFDVLVYDDLFSFFVVFPFLGEDFAVLDFHNFFFVDVFVD